ncbi:SDR family NAD(P)-dependent oxidoreductase [Jannaschia sp. LMIT008]|uniref:SDR family NAD(P)-dependent oxidoreductase n=1 Tax=Jannaschia maritima TaxID=3032585 RepID=UPI002810CB56|nr:SDR family oxidoreductase [Jannaschia sp. LMIT008]
MRRVLITGAAGGIGADMVRHFARDHAVTASDLPSDALEALGRETGATVVPCDLGDPDDIAALAAAATADGLDVLVNNAATYKLRPWLEIDAAEFDRITAVNQRGTFLLSQACHPALRASGTGRIVNVTSNTFFKGWEGLMTYVATKGGITGMSRVIAREVGGDGITVNCVAPGAIPTAAEDHHPDPEGFHRMLMEFQAVKRRGSTDDIARAVAFFAHPDNGFVTGQTLIVDGGGMMQ